MNFLKFLSGRFLTERTTVNTVVGDKLSVDINLYLLSKGINVSTEPSLASDIKSIFDKSWSGGWSDFLDAVYRKFLNITTTREIPFSEIQNLMKRQGSKEFFSHIFALKGTKTPERGKRRNSFSIAF
jgi:hypothetical protein